jgi:hypothetical protein
MNIDEQKLNIIKCLLSPDNNQASSPTTRNNTPTNMGPQQIFVLDRGFVYVGTASLDGDFWTLANARNIRVWGTTKGLGELVSGPTATTKLDDAGTVIVPTKSVIAIIPCTRSW